MPKTLVLRLMLSSALIAVSHPVYAQSQEAPAKASEAPKTSETKPKEANSETPKEDQAPVVVTGQRQPNRIDRQVYDPKTDPDTATSTAADVLNKVPSVNVDPEGNVSLRGNSGVQVLVDGKPSATMQGDMRAATLQSLSGDDIESIEVMTNPSAQFGAEGTGGIININLKRNRRPGKSGVFAANAGSDGGYRLGFSGGYSKGKATSSGGLTLGHGVRDTEFNTRRDRTNPLTGVKSKSLSEGEGQTEFNFKNLTGSLDLNVSDKDSFGLQFQVAKRDSENVSDNRNLDFGASGLAISDYKRLSRSQSDRLDQSARLRFDHKGDQDGETFKAEVRLSLNDDEADTFNTNLYSLGGTNNRERFLRYSTTQNIDLNVDYDRRIFGGELATGFEFDINRNEFDNRFYTLDFVTAAETINPIRTNQFVLDQDETEAYITFQKPLSPKWIILAGIRVENTSLTINQITSKIYRTNDYTKIHPSLNLSYILSPSQRLRFSYSNRLRRPSATDLNPFVIYRDERNVSTGNPDLKPQETDSFELGYEYSKSGLTYALRAYYRKDTDSFVERSQFVTAALQPCLSGPDCLIVLTGRDNGGRGQQGGLEFTFSGRATPKLNLNISGNLAYNELENLFNNIRPVRSGTSLSGRVSANYQLSPKDRFQVSVRGEGKQLTGQGFTEPYYVTDLSYSHRFDTKLSINARIADVFDSSDRKTITETDTIKDVTIRRWGGRIFFIGLTYNPFAKPGDKALDMPEGGRGRWREGSGF
jgi:outer membrane receptor protein involved in Fe transport